MAQQDQIWQDFMVFYHNYLKNIREISQTSINSPKPKPSLMKVLRKKLFRRKAGQEEISKCRNFQNSMRTSIVQTEPSEASLPNKYFVCRKLQTEPIIEDKKHVSENTCRRRKKRKKKSRCRRCHSSSSVSSSYSLRRYVHV